MSQQHKKFERRMQMRDERERMGLPRRRDELAEQIAEWKPRWGFTGTVSDHALMNFYRSSKWKELRERALARYGRKCMRCGCNEWLVVDHIYNVRAYWERRFDSNNLQILCDPCNRGKGSWVTIDFRPDVLPPENAR